MVTPPAAPWGSMLQEGESLTRAVPRLTLAPALAILKRRPGEQRWAALSDNARVMYTAGLLVCSTDGFVSKADMDAALADPSAVNAARQLLAKVGW